MKYEKTWVLTAVVLLMAGMVGFGFWADSERTKRIELEAQLDNTIPERYFQMSQSDKDMLIEHWERLDAQKLIDSLIIWDGNDTIYIDTAQDSGR